MSTVPTILLTRHAQGSFGSTDYDVLTPRGHAQAAALADDLARRRVRIDRIVSGGLVRQRDTAAPIAASAGCSIIVDPGWDEYDADDILSSHSSTHIRLEPEVGYDAQPISSRDFQDVLEPALLAWIAAGQEGATREPWNTFMARVTAALAEVVAQLGTGETALVVTSGGVLAALCVALLRVPTEAFIVFNRVVVNAGVTKIVHGRAGATLISFNTHSHLEQDGCSLITYR